jgi:hypothetical protein
MYPPTHVSTVKKILQSAMYATAPNMIDGHSTHGEMTDPRNMLILLLLLR